MLREFQEFALKGNMLDLAIGFILGAAFGTVVKSLVDDNHAHFGVRFWDPRLYQSFL